MSTTAMAPDLDTVFRAFEERNPGVRQLFEMAIAIGDEWYEERQSHSMDAKRFAAFTLCVQTYEIAQEVFLLARAGLGRGAQARLRSAFEYTAVAAFLQRNPDMAEKFVGWQHAENTKELEWARKVFAAKGDTEYVDVIESRLAELAPHVAAYKQKFGKDAASKWHEGMPKMCESLGWELHFFHCYFLQNRYVHPSPLMVERGVSGRDEGLFFDGGAALDCADDAVRGVLCVLGLSYAVAMDLGVPIRDEQLKGLIAAYTKMYQGVRHKLTL